MTGQLWLDYSVARPTDAQLTEAGVFGVSRYLSFVNSLTIKKIIQPHEYSHLVDDLGIGVHLNYEWYTGRCAEGYNSGKIDGQIALGQAKNLGYPKGLPITFSDDTCCTPLSALDNYLRGAHDGMGGYYKVGCYGGITPVNHVLANGRAVFGWQTRAWSNGLISTRAHLYQYSFAGGIPGTDANRVLREPPFAWYDGGNSMVHVDSISAPVLAQIADFVLKRDGVIENYGNPADSVSLGTWSTQINARLKKLNDATVAQIAAAVVAALPANPGGGATPAEVETAVRKVLTGTFLTPPAP